MEKKRKERRKRRKQELLVFVKTCLFGKIIKIKKIQVLLESSNCQHFLTNFHYLKIV
jgi:hypothetical protein